MPVTTCSHFNGYKPCGKNEHCHDQCPAQTFSKFRILIVHLGALGAVVRSTALLKSIHLKYPAAHITWVTQKPADQLLKNNPLIDRILTNEKDDLLTLSCLAFDVGFCIDKSTVAMGVIQQTSVQQLYGFKVDARSGAILPANQEATELWELGLSNEKKFFINVKPETELIAEALVLKYQRDDYNLVLTEAEQARAQQRRVEWAGPNPLVIGLNTGCSGVIPYKKLTVEKHRELIVQLQKYNAKIVLLGGQEDRLRNQQISYGLDVVCTPTHGGLRDGLISIEACDIVISGDSLGMHMAIALKKWVVAWFGPTCAHEIDLFDRGVKVLAEVGCSPCWKRSCHKSPMCYDLVRIHDLLNGVEKGVQWLTLSSIQHLSGISSSTSRYLSTPEEFSPPTV